MASVADFLRYHTLFRAFDGDIGRWLSLLEETGRAETDDAAFLRALQACCARDPELLTRVRKCVDSAGLWPAQMRAGSASVLRFSRNRP